MKKLLLSLVFLTLSATPSFARARMFGFCEQGNQTIQVLGYVSSPNTPIQASYPKCSVTVYVTGSQSIQTGTYQSGGTIVGTPGQTITLFLSGGTGATATATLTGTNAILAGTSLVINTGGSGFTGPATTATCGSGTATCTGTVTITTTVTGTLATLYSDNSGNALTNPFLSNAQGLWYAYADNGRYDVQFSGGTPAAIPNAFTEGDQFLIDPLYDSEFSSISQGCTFAAAIPATLTITRPWLGLPTQTFACDMLIQDGGYLQPSSGQVLTFAGVRGGLYRIFDVSQGGSIGSLVTPVLYPEWFGCVPDTPPLSPMVTNNNACMTAVFGVSNTNRIKVYINSNPAHPGYCYGITQAIQVGNGTNPTFVSTDGNFQNLGANGGNGQWAGCIVNLIAAQDTFDVTYPTTNKANSISFKNFSIQYSQGIPGNYVAPYGKVSVSGSVVTLQTATFLNFNTNWVQAGGHASIYIQHSTLFGCPGNICQIVSVQSTTQLTIAQTCASNCPTSANYSVGVGIHITNPIIQTVGLVLDGIQVMQAGVGYSSDGGDQNPLIENTTFNICNVGYMANGEVAIPQWNNDYFQGSVTVGMLVPDNKVILNGKLDSSVMESNGVSVEVDPGANIVGGVWTNLWLEFPITTHFAVYGSIHDWSCVGCILNFSSIPGTSIFTLFGNPGTQANMFNISLVAGYAPNIVANTGSYLTVARSLTGAIQDPTSTGDPNFSDWNFIGFNFASAPMHSFTTPNTGTGIEFVSSRSFSPSLFIPSLVNGTIPSFIEIGRDPVGIAVMNLGAPLGVPSGLLYLDSQLALGPNSTPVAYATLNVNNNLNSAGFVNTSDAGGVFLVTIQSVNFGSQTLRQSWANQSITINAVNYTIKSVVGPTTFILTSDPGNQTGVAFSIQGVTREIVQAGPGQGSGPLMQWYPCGSNCGGSNTASYDMDHNGFPSCADFGSNTDACGNLVLSGSGGPSGSATNSYTFIYPATTYPPFCRVWYQQPTAPASLPTLIPQAVVTVTTLTIYGNAVNVAYSCERREP